MQKKRVAAGISNEILCAEYKAIYHYALSICRDEVQAEDLTQETFLKAMSAADHFKGDSSLYTWLCAIAKNLWINKCKRQSREIVSENILDAGKGTGNSVEHHIVEKETIARIHRILHNLDEPYKEVFTLRVFGELPFSEIAKLFSKTESWARVTYHRAKRKINEQAEKEDRYND